MRERKFVKKFLLRFTEAEFRKVENDAWLRRMSIAEHIRDLVGGWKWELDSQSLAGCTCVPRVDMGEGNEICPLHGRK